MLLQMPLICVLTCARYFRNSDQKCRFKKYLNEKTQIKRTVIPLLKTKTTCI